MRISRREKDMKIVMTVRKKKQKKNTTPLKYIVICMLLRKHRTDLEGFWYTHSFAETLKTTYLENRKDVRFRISFFFSVLKYQRYFSESSFFFFNYWLATTRFECHLQYEVTECGC